MAMVAHLGVICRYLGDSSTIAWASYPKIEDSNAHVMCATNYHSSAFYEDMGVILV
jgi:hypothetical protein